MSFRLRLQHNIQRTHIYFVRRILFQAPVPSPPPSLHLLRQSSSELRLPAPAATLMKTASDLTQIRVSCTTREREKGGKGHTAMAAPLFTETRGVGGQGEWQDCKQTGRQAKLSQNWTIFLAIQCLIFLQVI